MQALRHTMQRPRESRRCIAPLAELKSMGSEVRALEVDDRTPDFMLINQDPH